jgi:hypothetical protein
MKFNLGLKYQFWNEERKFYIDENIKIKYTFKLSLIIKIA